MAVDGILAYVKAVAESGRNPVSRHQMSGMTRGGRTERVSREDQIIRRNRDRKTNFPGLADHKQHIGNHHTLLNVLTVQA